MAQEQLALPASPRGTGFRRVLVVDDQPGVREALRLLLKSADYAVDLAASPREALAAAAYNEHDAMLIDMNYGRDTTSGREGLALLDNLHARHSKAPIIVMTAWSTIELAVEAMQHGARDFIAKPWDNLRLLEILEKHLAPGREEHTLLDAELAIARRVQRKLLPEPRFRAGSLECECVCLPVGEIGGDLCDVFEAGAGRVAFLLGDVSGKGIGAALLMANLLATIRSQREFAASPAELLSRVNRLFFRSTRPEHYATLFFGLYDEATHRICYVNCGQPPGVLLRADGGTELLDSTATLLGAFEECAFEQRCIAVEPGDRLVLYSDGVSEADPRIENDGWVVDAIRTLSLICSSKVRPGKLAGSLASAARSFGEQMDDISVMDLRICSKQIV